MATIKLQPSGAVVLKDGKVACACCAQPTECCPYPAQAFVDGLYSADDLPDFIEVAGNLLIKQSTGFPRYAYPDSGEFYVNDPEEEGDLWSVVIFGSTSFGLDCLISSFNGSAPLGTEDLFANSYTITYPPTSISVVVTRVSLCVWQGNDGCGRPWYLIYGTSIFGSGNDYTWFIFMAIDENTVCGDFQQPAASKIGFQNTPVGNYSGNNNGTVS